MKKFKRKPKLHVVKHRRSVAIQPSGKLYEEKKREKEKLNAIICAAYLLAKFGN